MLWRKEWYPFSHFPMYSVFSSKVIALHVTDAEGRLLPMQPVFGTSSSTLKKIITTKMRHRKREGRYRRWVDMPLSEWEAAGAETLQWLVDNHPPRRQAPGTRLRLHMKELELRDGRVHRGTVALAEL